jgi:hypothetical protein
LKCLNDFACPDWSGKYPVAPEKTGIGPEKPKWRVERAT